ncbi:50S ribosomal protein L3, partial [Candidatus Woesearchaeota archaeon]|nr:50S ribosomal protein L3 [Candidatus Woesearchaeota archaeon]
TRTEKNKWIVKISNEDINPKGGFKHYGLVKNDYILIKGSIPGPTKRLVRLYKAKRPSKKMPSEPPSIEAVVI